MIATFTFRDIVVLTYDSEKKYPLVVHEEAEQCDFVIQDLFLLSKFLLDCALHKILQHGDVESISVN